MGGGLILAVTVSNLRPRIQLIQSFKKVCFSHHLSCKPKKCYSFPNNNTKISL